MESFTTAGAGAAVVSPWWLPGLAGISEYAALILPILGVLWLLVQISTKIYGAIKR